MHVFWTWLGCDNADQTKISEVWRTRQHELESLSALAAASQQSPLVMTVEHADASPRWNMHAALYAPFAAASGTSHSDDVLTAIDELVGQLSEQMNEQSQQPLNPAQRRRGLTKLEPVLEQLHRTHASGQFLQVLNPALDAVHHYLVRELRTREALGEIPAGQTSVADVRNDVLLKAWEQFPERSHTQPLDMWLIGLIEGTLDQLQAPISDRSLQDREALALTTRESQNFEEVEHVTDYDSQALAAMIADGQDVEPWDRLTIEDRQTKLDQLLQSLPRPQRHVLMLHAVEGFTQAEIADIQNRSSQAVANDWQTAREQLHHVFNARLPFATRDPDSVLNANDVPDDDRSSPTA